MGLALGSLTKSLLGVIITYSVITGVGFGLMYIPSIVAVANHFTRQRSLAIGVCLCGAGVGTFALSPLQTFITQTYGWRAAFLSLAVLSGLCSLCGATMTRVERLSWQPAQPSHQPTSSTTSQRSAAAARGRPLRQPHRDCQRLQRQRAAARGCSCQRAAVPEGGLANH